MFLLDFDSKTTASTIIIIMGLVAIMLLPLVAALIIRSASPAFLGRKCSYGYALNAGIYGFVGLILPMLCLQFSPLYLDGESLVSALHFFSASALCLNLLTTFLAVMYFHRIPWPKAAALASVTYLGSWVFLFFFAALPQWILMTSSGA